MILTNEIDKEELIPITNYQLLLLYYLLLRLSFPKSFGKIGTQGKYFQEKTGRSMIRS